MASDYMCDTCGDVMGSNKTVQNQHKFRTGHESIRRVPKVEVKLASPEVIAQRHQNIAIRQQIFKDRRNN